MSEETGLRRGRGETGIAEMALAMAIAGSIGVFVVESEQPPFTVVFYRCLFGALALGGYCLWRGLFAGLPLIPARRSLGRFALLLLGGAFLVYNWVLLFAAYGLTSISIATIVYHVNPFIILIFGRFVFAESLDRHKLAWTAVAFAGLIGVIGIPAGLEGDYVRGIACALLATTLYSCTIVVSKWLQDIPPAVIAFCQVGFGTLLVLPFVALSAGPDLARQWAFLVGLGVLHTGVEYLLLYSAFRKLSMALIAILSFVYPVVAVMLDYLVYGHALTPLQLAGVALIALATLGVRLGWRVSPRLSRAG